MAGNVITSPYVGLRPFGEAERAFFFGRERDIRVISANILEEPLTVVYGPSGAGKSSVLQAGILPKLKLLPNAAAVYFRNWQGDNFQDELKACILEALAAEFQVQGGSGESSAAAGQTEPAAKANLSMQDLLLHTRRQVFLLLDQFEEYLLYHTDGGSSGSFDSILAQVVNRDDIRTRVLLGLREDGLSRLNERFAIRIPDLLGNTLQVERLNLKAARNAIQEPLRVFSETPAAQGQKFAIEEKLVQAIMEQVQEGRGIAGDFAGKGIRGSDTGAQIETAYLQLVLTKLWKAERKQNSTLLRWDTFDKMGGASKIVRDHVNAVMNGLENDSQRDIAARLFVYLVTPSRTKIAQRTEDLVTFGEAPEAEVKKVLNKLAEQQETRILRRLSNPEQYEIFHDVLAQHILDWRRGYEEQKRLAEQKRLQQAEAARKQHELEQAQALAKSESVRAQEQALAAKRLRAMVAVLIMLSMLAVGAAIWGAVEQKRAKLSALEAKANQLKAEEAAAELEIANKARRDVETREQQARNAEKAGNQQLADQYRVEAEAIRLKAADAEKQAQNQSSLANSLAQQVKTISDDRDKLKQELLKTTSDRDNYKAQVDELHKKYESTGPPSKSASRETVQQGPPDESLKTLADNLPMPGESNNESSNGWKKYSNTKGNFTALFPSDPQDKINNNDNNSHSLLALQQGDAYAVIYYNMKDQQKVDEATFQRFKNVIFKALPKCKVGTELPAAPMLQDFIGHWYRLNCNISKVNVTYVGNLYWGKHYAYWVTVVYQSNAPEPADVKKFLQSFSLLDQLK